MNVYVIQKKKYYNVDELMAAYPTIFKGSRSSRLFITKHNISNDHYLFAKHINDEWSESNGKSMRFDKVMIRKKYFDREYMEEYEKNLPKNLPKQHDEMPPIIELGDKEKFFNNDGNIFNIEMIGEKEYDKCYFKLSDVAVELNTPNLRYNILDKRYDVYVEGEHYVFFHPNKLGNSQIQLEKSQTQPVKQQVKKVLYMNKPSRSCVI